MRSVPFVFLFFTIYSSVLGEVDSTIFKNIYYKETIYFSGSENKYFKGDLKYPVRFLAEEFRFSPEGKNLYHLSVVDSRKQRILGSIGLGMFISGLIVDDKRIGFSLFAGSIVPNIISIKLGGRSASKRHKAVWIRNRDILSRKR
jgi:hypothetical protein